MRAFTFWGLVIERQVVQIVAVYAADSEAESVMFCIDKLTFCAVSTLRLAALTTCEALPA